MPTPETNEGHFDDAALGTDYTDEIQPGDTPQTPFGREGFNTVPEDTAIEIHERQGKVVAETLGKLSLNGKRAYVKGSRQNTWAMLPRGIDHSPEAVRQSLAESVAMGVSPEMSHRYDDSPAGIRDDIAEVKSMPARRLHTQVSNGGDNNDTVRQATDARF